MWCIYSFMWLAISLICPSITTVAYIKAWSIGAELYVNSALINHTCCNKNKGLLFVPQLTFPLYLGLGKLLIRKACVIMTSPSRRVWARARLHGRSWVSDWRRRGSSTSGYRTHWPGKQRIGYRHARSTPRWRRNGGGRRWVRGLVEAWQSG